MAVVPVTARVHVQDLADQAGARDLDEAQMVLRKAQHVAGQDEACGAPGSREQWRDGRRRLRDRLLDERAKVALKRLKSDLDVRGGRRSDDDRVRPDLLDEAQGIGE